MILGFLLWSAGGDWISYLAHCNAKNCKKQDQISSRSYKQCKTNLAVACYTNSVSALCMQQTYLVNADRD